MKHCSEQAGMAMGATEVQLASAAWERTLAAARSAAKSGAVGSRIVLGRGGGCQAMLLV